MSHSTGTTFPAALKAHYVELDVTNHGQWSAVLDEVHQTHGALHILMNIVGTNELDMIGDIDVDKWNKVFDTNVTSILVGIQTCARAFRPPRARDRTERHRKCRWRSVVPVAQLVQVAGLRPPTYRFPVPGTASVFSSTYVTPEQLAWLAQQFGGWVRDDNPDGWTVVVGPGYYDIVGLENGTNDIPGMPPQIIQPVARWLGRQPQYRLSLIFGDTRGCNERAWDIALFFARWWPAIWSNHSTDPVVPLGSWWTR